MKRKLLAGMLPTAAIIAVALTVTLPASADAQFGETGMRNTYLDVCTGCWYLDWPYGNCDCTGGNET